MESVNILLYGATRDDSKAMSIITYYFTVCNTPIGVKVYADESEDDYNTLLREACDYAYHYYMMKGSIQ